VTCEDLEGRLEAIASGDATWRAADDAHVSTCDRCRKRLALAQAVERVLPTLRVAEPPASFTGDVMARVRRERWRAEQILDTGFNVAIAAGLILIVVGVAGLAWSTGLVVVGADAAALMGEALAAGGALVAPHLPIYGAAATLLTTAFGIWWWIEGTGVER
jgi:hypothetical protein